MPVHEQKDVCNQDEIVQEMYAKYVVARINTNKVSVWATMKKVQQKMWKSARKTVKHKLADQVVELEDDRSLFTRMLIVARSRPEISLKESIVQHDFTSLHRALFSVNGALLPATYKSKLMAILEELSNQKKPDDDLQPREVTNVGVPTLPKKVTAIDEMAVVHSMGKPPWVKTCANGLTTA